jgi:hypothetical protein
MLKGRMLHGVQPSILRFEPLLLNQLIDLPTIKTAWQFVLQSTPSSLSTHHAPTSLKFTPSLTCGRDGLPLPAPGHLRLLPAALLVLRLALGRQDGGGQQAGVGVLAAVGVLLVRPRRVAHVGVGAGKRPVQQLLDVVLHALVVRVSPQEVEVCQGNVSNVVKSEWACSSTSGRWYTL